MSVPSSSVLAAKQAVRREVRARLRTVTEESLQQQSAATAARVLAHPAYVHARRLSVYLTMPKGELRTDAIVRDALSKGKEVFIPFTRLEEPNTMKMLHLASLEELEGLQLTKWRIPEHHSAQGVKEAFDPDGDGLDLILLPGLAFDQSRTRCGHGRGYYDRYLALAEVWCRARGQAPPITLALALQEQLVDQPLPCDASDRKPQFIVHPHGIIA